MYEAYKSLRNHAAKLNLANAFESIWCYSQHLLNERPLPFNFVPGRPQGLVELVHPWELSLLAREVVLHALPRGAKILNTYGTLASAISRIRRVEDEVAKTQEAVKTNIVVELQRIAHRQFPWQHRRDMMNLMRYLKIFGEQEVEAVLERETGLSMRHLYFMGLAVGGHLLNHPGINATQDYSAFGIDGDAAVRFFGKMGTNIDALRARTLGLQCYDHRWAYTWNPLEATPLVALDPKQPHLLHCPIPWLLLKRITHGVFYDLINAVDFDNPYGIAFQRYVGELIRQIYPASRFTLWEESPYIVDSNIRHGADWILSDATGTVFIECKTKRLTYTAKTALEGKELDEQVGILATAVAQLYRNIADAIGGRIVWRSRGEPIYPLLITLEDWYLLSPHTLSVLDNCVRSRLSEYGLDPQMVDSMPYTIGSATDIEVVSQTIASVGIDAFFRQKCALEHRQWMLIPFSWECFPGEARSQLPTLFQSDWERVLPEVAATFRL